LEFKLQPQVFILNSVWLRFGQCLVEVWWRFSLGLVEACLRLGQGSPFMTRRPIPPKYFENIIKTNDSVGVTRQQT